MQKQTRDFTAGFLGAVAALVLFAWLATQVFHHATIRFDAAVRDGVHSLASPALTRFFRVVTQFGSELFLAPFCLVVVWRLVAAGRRRAAIVFAVAAAGGESLDYILKLLFRRERPPVFFGIAAPHSYSFPSGHSMLSACIFGVLAAILTTRMKSRGKRAAIWATAAIATLTIGLSRVYLGVHYPSDVLAGYSAAVIWVSSVAAGYHVWLRRASSAAPREQASK